jgi:LmbE family N-acetylglucosaminyl deacetylase
MTPHVNTVILAPHIDDEVLGCFSYLNESTFVHCIGVEDRSYVSREERVKELERAARLKRFKWHVSNHRVNSYQCHLLIPELEARINALKPETILIPQPCYNQDHRAVYDAAMVAIRPHDRNWLVPTVLLYEQPHVFVWPYGHGAFEPNYFRPIDITAKLELYEVYASQVRGHRSPALLTALAQLRGAAINAPYAEAFFCKRKVHPA